MRRWSLCKAAKTTFEILTFKIPHTEIFQRCIISLEFQIEWWKKINWFGENCIVLYFTMYIFSVEIYGNGIWHTFFTMINRASKNFIVNWNTPIPQFAISILIFESIQFTSVEVSVGKCMLILQRMLQRFHVIQRLSIFIL